MKKASSKSVEKAKAKAKADPNERYPRLKELGVRIIDTGDGGMPSHVIWDEVYAALDKHKLDWEDFHKLFGCQTCCSGGPYPYDVEAVLERMMSGKLTGTQKHWD